ncbi:sigma 54-interacting transcriptional regulator [Aliiroseovarius sp. F47248L]|uniref:sigma-54-dependent Fis family transcriptional regulator n=1 Tax=Aliiroseovarius sp. F47248L TaxID=2926420 RepID=UPI001FF262A0|nr:sigma 54-interacting transcriptional regulator [Aliiroseovarius sp. F47248L]MCK0139863.1 sigma 54-interacting transcriptional regulator [Aliiroseovarius sp. F47248L]
MTDLQTRLGKQTAINASWERCERDYNLERNAAHPILRLQSSEVAPRLEEMTERTGGKQGIFRQLATLAADAGHCLVITDKDGILVRLESKNAGEPWNGIALGSVWDERIAGTNGVSMALAEGRDITVRGTDHYYAQLKSFACCAVPLRDAANKVIGVANVVSIDNGNPANSLFAQQLLGAAASRIQHTLFERAFKDQSIVSVAMPGRRDLIKGSELIAVDESGAILGATAAAHRLAGFDTHDLLAGLRFEDAFGTDVPSLDHVPDRVLSVRRDQGPMLDLWAREPLQSKRSVAGWRPVPTRAIGQRPDRPLLKELAIGSPALRELCERAKVTLEHALPLLLEGETGTGKTALIAALLGEDTHSVTVDCAALDASDKNHAYVQSLIEQARIAGALREPTRKKEVLVFDNIDEMPSFAQAALRNALDAADASPSAQNVQMQIIASSRRPLKEAVTAGTFRDDLYFMLSGAAQVLPPLRNRNTKQLAKSVAARLSGKQIELSQEACDAINNYSWPGNLRELQSVLRQALIQGDGARITRLDLGLPNMGEPVPARPAIAQPIYNEEQMLVDALNGARWNISKAARTLGIGRATIHRKMKAYGISRPA